MEDEKASPSSNPFKVRAYARAINAIRQVPEHVQSVEQVRHLNGIGVRIADRIDAYLSGTTYKPSSPSRSRKIGSTLTERTGPKSRKTLDELRREQVVSSLSSISGIGTSKANVLYDAGCRSLLDLMEHEFFRMLSHPQQINTQYMIGLDRRVSQEQASAVRDFVSENVSSEYIALLSGDIRRGASSARSISLIVLHPHTIGIFPPEGSPSIDSTIKQRSKSDVIPSPFLRHPQTKVKFKGQPDAATFSTEIISPLECRGLIVATITTSAQMWDGIVRIPERIESGDRWAETNEAVKDQFSSAKIYYVPRQCAGAASIALTGDLQFNLAVRRAASRLGMRLNEYGLWRWRGANVTISVDDLDKQMSIDQHGGFWELVSSGKSEEDIMEVLQMEWVPPERRNFANLDVRPRKRRIENL